jgi:hypothetical protein
MLVVVSDARGRRLACSPGPAFVRGLTAVHERNDRQVERLARVGIR